MVIAPGAAPGFHAPWWARGPHAQTLWGAFFRRTPLPPGRFRRLNTPDGDFVDVFRLAARPDAPRLLILHGLEGTTHSHYARGLLHRAAAAGWGADMLIFRGCGPELNRTPRFYHSGETRDLELLATDIELEFPHAPLTAVGYSLGGNVLLKWLGQAGSRLPSTLVAAAAVSVPYDLEAGARYLSRGVSHMYERHFLRTLKAKAAAKLQRFPEAYDPTALAAVRTIVEFDDAVTAPLHGFANAQAYYTACSAQHFLPRIQVSTLLIGAYDDPFLPPDALGRANQIAAANPALVREFSPCGGHVGFVTGSNPIHPTYYSEDRVVEFFTSKTHPSPSA